MCNMIINCFGLVYGHDFVWQPYQGYIMFKKLVTSHGLNTKTKYPKNIKKYAQLHKKFKPLNPIIKMHRNSKKKKHKNWMQIKFYKTIWKSTIMLKNTLKLIKSEQINCAYSVYWS